MVSVGDRDALATALVELIAALVPGSARLLPLDAGPLSSADFDRAAQEYVQEFTFERVAAQMVRGVQELEHARLDR